jgi:hypothetical protein
MMTWTRGTPTKMSLKPIEVSDESSAEEEHSDTSSADCEWEDVPKMRSDPVPQKKEIEEVN